MPSPSFRQYLLLAFLLIAAVLTAAAMQGLAVLEDFASRSRGAAGDALRLSRVVQLLGERAVDMTRSARQYRLLGEPALFERFVASRAEAVEAIDGLGSLVTIDLAPILPSLRDWRQSAGRVEALLSAAGDEDALFAELSRLAVEQLFEELGVEPETSPSGPLLRFAAGAVEVFVGDVFDLTAEMLGAVDAVYDRAALVALPAGLRERYAAHVAAITRSAPQFLICMEYDQSARQGPPFSIDGAEVRRVHGARYQVTELARTELEGGLKAAGPVQETVWLLR